MMVFPLRVESALVFPMWESPTFSIVNMLPPYGDEYGMVFIVFAKNPIAFVV